MKTAAFIIIFLSLVGCVATPKETIELSDELSDDAANVLKTAHEVDEGVDKFFETMKKIDETLQQLKGRKE